MKTILKDEVVYIVQKKLLDGPSDKEWSSITYEMSDEVEAFNFIALTQCNNPNLKLRIVKRTITEEVIS